MRKKLLNLTTTAIALSCFFVIAGCGFDSNRSSSNEKIDALVSITPLTEFVSRIGGDKVTVESIIPPGYEPHSYELSPTQLTRITEAELYVKAGHIEFEKAQMDKLAAQNEEMKIIDGSAGVRLRDIENGGRESIHEYEDKARQGESQPDPHTWLSVTNAKIYVQNIANALGELDPDNENYYQQNQEKYSAELDEVNLYLQNKLGRLENKKILVYHPAFGYLLDDYGLQQIPVEIEGKEPTAAQLAELIAEAKRVNVKTIFVQQQFSPKNAETIAQEIGGSVVPIDPLATDFAANLKSIGDALSDN